MHDALIVPVQASYTFRERFLEPFNGLKIVSRKTRKYV